MGVEVGHLGGATLVDVDEGGRPFAGEGETAKRTGKVDRDDVIRGSRGERRRGCLSTSAPRIARK